MGKKQKQKPTEELAELILKVIKGYGIGTVIGLILAIIIVILANKGILD